AYADDLSTAVAVARLIQDVSDDWQRGRVYLPAGDLRHFGVTEADIESHRVNDAVGSLVRYEVARTRALFERARPLVDLAGPDLAVELAPTSHGGLRVPAQVDASRA